MHEVIDSEQVVAFRAPDVSSVSDTNGHVWRLADGTDDVWYTHMRPDGLATAVTTVTLKDGSSRTLRPDDLTYIR